ncbi:MAG TPA: hypothetical protein VH702_10895, partial [Vicinamibacterales bacterium]
MRTRISLVLTGIAGLVAGSLMHFPWASAQQRSATSELRMAAVPGEKGGQDIFGPYEPVTGWPKALTSLPGHEGWTFGAGQSVFAESPNRVFVLQRGELPALGRPKTTRLPQLGPSI